MPCFKTYIEYYIYCNNDSRLNTFDLQRFNQEKTEEATPKKKEEARKHGQVAKSVEINSAFAILSAFLALNTLGPFIYLELTDFMKYMFTNFIIQDISLNTVSILFILFASVLLKTALPVMLVIGLVSLITNTLQVGIYFSLEPIAPQLNRLNPISGFQRLFSKRSLVELIKSLFKVTIIGYFVYTYIAKEIHGLPNLIKVSLTESFIQAANLVVNLVFQICMVMLVLAALDYFYQWWEHNQNIKMSKQEVKEEFKQIEGNPQIKGKIKEKQRMIAMQRMMQEVPKADVIITNPTHLAIALKYDSKMTAPIVIAKGKDLIAEKIKSIAKDNNIILVENKPLAQVLFKSTEIGELIPPELYQAVAEVLAYVFRIKKRLT